MLVISSSSQQATKCIFCLSVLSVISLILCIFCIPVSCARIEVSHTHLTAYPIGDPQWQEDMRLELKKTGVLQLSHFLTPEALSSVTLESAQGLAQAWFDPRHHNIYLSEDDPDFPPDHIRNRHFLSSKGCITDDQISSKSPLKCLYNNPTFTNALATILNEEKLYAYADSLSSINIHYARLGEGLNWHFDNSSFAVTLMISPAMKGGDFEYVRDVRDADRGEMGYDLAASVVNGDTVVNALTLTPGDLLLFRGRNSLHRVTSVTDAQSVRQLATLAYNNTPGAALSEKARMTFFGRLGEVNLS